MKDGLVKDGLEIERKWLLAMLPSKWRASKELTMIQLYGIDEFGTFRIRMQYGTDNPCQLFLTRKEHISDGVCQEFEKEISMSEFDEFKAMCDSKLTKTRFYFLYKGLTFEIDLYDKMNLVTMEVELSDINQPVEIPDFINGCIIMEVTGNKSFTNYHLSKLLLTNETSIKSGKR